MSTWNYRVMRKLNDHGECMYLLFTIAFLKCGR